MSFVSSWYKNVTLSDKRPGIAYRAPRSFLFNVTSLPPTVGHLISCEALGLVWLHYSVRLGCATLQLDQNMDRLVLWK